ncbi:MAG: hypothetical protein JWO04_4383 [Gammaproteobacteria bacterium]|nr:hypothetical protein [Gammaproteobacteria bacterium]
MQSSATANFIGPFPAQALFELRAHCGDVRAEVILRLNAEGWIESTDALKIDRYGDDLSVEDALRAIRCVSAPRGPDGALEL